MRASSYLGDLGGLSRQRQLILLDLRGTGDSGVPTDPAGYRCDPQVADVEALRRHLGLDRVDVLATRRPAISPSSTRPDTPHTSGC
ncbi:alpha/beta fold hydrolase [Streptomyces kronopolitis]|uniref:alpha/beta fold hydrolase n=1 Tax=Streptomyces kronopolitis TaxID=1612435 RepID=UPI0036C1DA0E